MVDQVFIENVAAATPTPGGGGASAYCGALGSALSSMVGNITLGNKRYAQVWDEVQRTLDSLSSVRAELLDLVDRDAQAFEPLSAAYRMPRGTEEEAAQRHSAIQQALSEAIEAPLAIMRACARVIDYSSILACKGSHSALSDVAGGVSFAQGALKGAALNVYVNAASLESRDQAKHYTDEADRLIAEYGRKADEIYNHILKEIR